jgi:hypothetical protein
VKRGPPLLAGGALELFNCHVLAFPVDLGPDFVGVGDEAGVPVPAAPHRDPYVRRAEERTIARGIGQSLRRLTPR